MSAKRVVITGVGPVTPIGIGAADFWNALLEGRCGIRRIESFDPSRFESQIGGAVTELKVANYVPKAYRKAGKIMARDIALAVAAAHQAVSDAGLRTKCLIERGEAEGEPNFDPARFGANIGAGLICADLSELSECMHSASENGVFDIGKWGREGMQNLTPLWLLKFLPNMLACHVTIVHDAQGPSNTITCGEAASHLATGEAFRAIARGVADVCICGGAESKDNPMALIRQSLGKRVSTRNDSPETACRPFAKDRDGTVVSEGGGLVILEELEHAQKRGARIYGEVIGFGAANDVYRAGQPSELSPDGRGLALAMRKALKDAGIGPEDVDLITASGYGAVKTDRIEAAALKSVFGERLADVPVLSIKGGIGNNGAGSGAIDFIAGALCTQNNTIPPAINSQETDPECPVKLVTGAPVDAKIEHVLSTAFALTGGQCAAIVIRRVRQ